MALQIVTLEEIKEHTRIDSDAEDSLLVVYGESAEAITLKMLGLTYDQMIEKYEETPTPVRHAILMLVAHSYAQREPVSERNIYTVPYTYDLLIKPYMVL